MSNKIIEKPALFPVGVVHGTELKEMFNGPIMFSFHAKNSDELVKEFANAKLAQIKLNTQEERGETNG